MEVPVLGPSRTPGCLRGSLSKPIGKKAQEAQKGLERMRITKKGERRARRSKPNKLMKARETHEAQEGPGSRGDQEGPARPRKFQEIAGKPRVAGILFNLRCVSCSEKLIAS